MSGENTDFALVRRLLSEKAAIVLSEDKDYLIETRLSSLCGEKGIESIPSLIQRVRTGDRECMVGVIEALTTNETSFFRDIHPFEALKGTILPALIEANAGRRSLQIWCGAASTGQEPLTLAMLIREHFPELLDWNVRILATDINRTMLARSRAGLYSQLEVSRGLPARMLVKHFTKQGLQWKVNDDLLGMIDYKPLNLARPLPAMGPFDLVFLRNVLIYFSPETKAEILERVWQLMAPGSTLFLGTAETVAGLPRRFSTTVADKATYFRRVD